MENLKMIQMPMENNELAKLKRRIEIDEQIAALQAEKEEIDLYLINAINNSVDGKLTVGDKVASYVKESKSPYWTKDNLLDCHDRKVVPRLRGLRRQTLMCRRRCGSRPKGRSST